MVSPPLWVLMVGLAPIALTGCVEIEPATGSPIATASFIGADLGSSGRVPQIAGVAGEGEGYGRTSPDPSPVGHGSMDHRAMDHAGMDHAAMGHGSIDHGAIGHGSMPAMRDRSKDRGSGTAHGSMGHGSMHATNHGAKDRASGMSHGASGMRHGSQQKVAAAQGSMRAQGSVSESKPRPGAGDTQMAHSGHAHVQGTGTVNSVDAANRKVNVTHAPIPTIGWPSMTMDFAVAPAVDLNAVKPGSRIKFDMEQGQGGMYVIQSITPAGGGR